MGRVNKALRENWDWLIASYEALPDEAEEGANQDCLRVAAENKRTGVGRHRILNLMDDPPEGLTTNRIKDIIQNPHAQRHSADHIGALLEAYSVLPDRRPPRPKPKPRIKPAPPGHIHITKAVYNELWRLKTESGVSPRSLLEMAEDVPDGLTSTLIHRWLVKKINVARKEHIEFALNNWRELE